MSTKSLQQYAEDLGLTEADLLEAIEGEVIPNILAELKLPDTEHLKIEFIRKQHDSDKDVWDFLDDFAAAKADR